MALGKWFKRDRGSEVADSPHREEKGVPSAQSADRADLRAEDAQSGGAGQGLFTRLRVGLSKTRTSLVGKMDALLSARRVLDEELFEELEELLIQSDVGVTAALALVGEVREVVQAEKITDPGAIGPILQQKIRGILAAHSEPLQLVDPPPTVILVVGVNGAGKTTTIGKLAYRFKTQGLKVVLGAGDTFRAAAIEQLEVWADRVGVDIIKHQAGSDPAAVAYDAIQAGRARNADVVIIDTAGRLQTKTNLMRELEKIGRVVDRELDRRPRETLLVVDATTGQNALSQARMFSEVVDVTGLVLTKLDGTAKGGIIVAIAQELRLPVKLIGIGEADDDLRDFQADEFVSALFGD